MEFYPESVGILSTAYQTIRLFHYVILMPEENKLHDTLFNRVSKNLIDSIPFLNVISHLPASLDEYTGEWPRNTVHLPYDINYQIHYMYEKNVHANASFFQSCPFGCIFVLESVSRATINLLQSLTTLPIVSYVQGSKTLLSMQDKKLIRKIHHAWRYRVKETKNSRYVPQVSNWNPNRTQLKSYRAPIIKFLEPLTVMIDRLRGLYDHTGQQTYRVTPCSPENFNEKEEEADRLINESIRRLLSEKCLLLHLGYIQEGDFNEKDQQRMSSVGISESDLRTFLTKKSNTSYAKLVDRILSRFERNSIRSEFVICVPSINYHLLDSINDALKKDKFPKKILRVFYDHAHYYHVFDSSVLDAASEGKRHKNEKIFLGLLAFRAHELRFLSSISTLYALARRAPFIRTRNVPSFPFFQLADALSHYCDGMEERNKIPDFTKGMAELSAHIQKAIPVDTMNLINKHANSVKVISDLPVEWIDMNGMPLCVACNYSRVPITPGNGLVSHANSMNREYTLTKENMKVLLINTLSTTDTLFPLGRALRDLISNSFKMINKDIVYVETTDKEKFLKTIEYERPTIFIYYGHGKYDVHEAIGKLIIGEDSVTAIEMENLKWKPIIALLGACETQVMHGTHVNVANLFLGSGVLSVLGTFFPVKGLHALTFISNIMRHLVNCFINAAPEYFTRWDDIILQTYRTHYLLDVILSMESYLERRGSKLSSYPLDIMNKFWEYGHDAGYRSLEEYYGNRDIIFEKVFNTVPALGEAFRSIRDNNLILPQSLYYSSLGSPDKIKIKRGTNVVTLDDAQTHYLSIFGDK